MLFANQTQVEQLMKVMINTFAMSGLTLATSILPLIFAMFLSEIRCKWFKNFVQTFTTVPNFISWVMVYSVAYSLFTNTGMVNSMLMNAGIITTPIKFLDGDAHTWAFMLIWYTWKTLGWGSIMYLASIAGVDQELYEAARVDGAGRFTLMRHITLPALLPTFFVLLMLSIANFLNNGLDQFYVFQNSFNKEHIQVLDLYVYNVGMTARSPSLATAIGMLKSIVSVTLLFIVNNISKKLRGESII
jgi:multiple sugar transport system permease protein/putative aldouronate transport system permease protein